MAAVEYRTIKEVAERCRVAPMTVRGWLSRGLLRKHKAHGRVLVSEQDLVAFIKADAPQAAPDEAAA